MRVFVALDIPESVRAAIGGLIAKLRPVCCGARWVRIEGAHVTLKFIGEVPPEKIESIKSALGTIFLSAPIELIFRDVGFFPNAKRPRVFWAGIQGGAELGSLAAAVESALEPLGIDRDPACPAGRQRAFSPHLTLARLESPDGLDALRAAIAGPFEFGRGIASEFHLYQSILKRSGAEYTQLATFRFVRSQAR